MGGQSFAYDNSNYERSFPSPSKSAAKYSYRIPSSSSSFPGNIWDSAMKKNNNNDRPMNKIVPGNDEPILPTGNVNQQFGTCRDNEPSVPVRSDGLLGGIG